MTEKPLSPELRKEHENALSSRGGVDNFLFAVFVYFILYYGADYLLPVDYSWGILTVLGPLVAAVLTFRSQRANQIRDQRRKVENMPDDQLAKEYESHAKSIQQSNLLWALAIGALIFGLLFTPQGNEFIDAVFAESRK